MSYIQNNLQAGEEIKYKADIHWYIFAYPAATPPVKMCLERPAGDRKSVV